MGKLLSEFTGFITLEAGKKDVHCISDFWKLMLPCRNTELIRLVTFVINDDHGLHH